MYFFISISELKIFRFDLCSNLQADPIFSDYENFTAAR